MYDLEDSIKKPIVLDTIKESLTKKQIEELSEYVRSLETLYISRSLGTSSIEDSSVKYADNLIQIAIALESEIFLKLQDAKGTEEFSEAYHVIAQIMEYAAKLCVNNEKLKMEYWLRASLAYNYAGFSASSVFAAIQCEKMLNEENLNNNILRLVLRFLSRQFSSFKSLSDHIRNLVDSVTVDNIASQQEYFLKLGFSGLIRTMLLIIQFMDTGKSNDSWKSIEKRYHEFIQRSGDDFASWLSSRLHYTYYNSIKRSIWSIRDIIPEKIITALVSNIDPIYEIWESQEKALRDITSWQSKQHTIITMPTSAGKTLVAGILLAREILQTKRIAFYVTPLRALVDEASTFFTKYFHSIGLTVSYLPGDYDSIPSLEELVGQNARIYILTPEKLDLLWRVNDTRLGSVATFVFDEIQLVRERGRGMRLELLIGKLNEIFGHNTKIILLSAVIPDSNLSEFVKWLGSNTTEVFKTVWTPTRLREGYFYRGTDYAGNILYFRGGNENNTLRIKNVLPPIQKPEKESTKVKRTVLRPDSALLAWKYHFDFGPVLVYTNKKTETENIANMIFQLSSLDSSLSVNSNLLNASKQIREINNTLTLPDMVEKGIAYHHASMPEDVKHIIQKLAKDRDLKVIVANTTLAEGVNLNIKSVIISTPVVGGDVMDALRLRNLAGRAGRALRDTEGHVIIMHPDFIGDLLDINRSKIHSRFFHYLEMLSEDTELDTDSNALEANLLARLYKKEFSETDKAYKTRKILDSTFFSKQTNAVTFSKAYSKVLDRITKLINEPTLEDKNILRIFSETGLSFEYCKLLEQRVLELVKKNPLSLRINNEINFDIVNFVIKACIEATGKPLSPDVLKFVKDPILVIQMWMMGFPISNIVHKINPDDVKNETFGRISHFLYGYVMPDISWIATAFVKLLTYHVRENGLILEFDKEWELLPNYIKHGTTNSSSLLLILSDAYERDQANEKGSLNKYISKSSHDWLKIIGWISYITNTDKNIFEKIKDRLISRLDEFHIPIDLPDTEYDNLVLKSDGGIYEDDVKLTVIDKEILHLINSINTFGKCKTRFHIDNEGQWYMEVKPEWI